MRENELLMSSLSKVIVLQPDKCMHLVTRSHFQLRDKDGNHTIHSVIAKIP